MEEGDKAAKRYRMRGSLETPMYVLAYYNNISVLLALHKNSGEVPSDVRDLIYQ
jgi:hypothetical protein